MGRAEDARMLNRNHFRGAPPARFVSEKKLKVYQNWRVDGQRHKPLSNATLEIASHWLAREHMEKTKSGSNSISHIKICDFAYKEVRQLRRADGLIYRF